MRLLHNAANIQRFLTEDAELAKEVILAVAHSAVYSDKIYSHLDADQLGWLFDNLNRLFPPSEDPVEDDQVYAVTPRHDAGRFRDNVIGSLIKSATPEAINELDRICTAYPARPWLIRARADASNNLRRKERTQLTFAETVRILSDSKLTVVRNDRELMTVILEILKRFNHEAQHDSPPLAVFLWNEKQRTHFSEQRLSDFLKFYLLKELQERRIIINREVEIRNWRDSGVGERTDLFIQTIPSNSDIHQSLPCVVIEVKVDKNVKREDIPDQLVKKYLDGVSRTCGIYLVGWFGKSRYKNIAELRRNVDQYALENTTNKVNIKSVVLDLSHPLI